MTDHAQRAHARRAITCLYLHLPERIAKDVEEIIEAAFAEDDKRITQAHAEAERRVWREAAQHAATDACAIPRGTECQRLAAYFRQRADAKAKEIL